MGLPGGEVIGRAAPWQRNGEVTRWEGKRLLEEVARGNVRGGQAREDATGARKVRARGRLTSFPAETWEEGNGGKTRLQGEAYRTSCPVATQGGGEG